MALHYRRTDEQERLTRRAVLSLGAAGLAATAGCAQLSSDDDDADDSLTDRFPDEEDVFTDVDVLTLRFDTTGEVIRWDESTRRRRQYLVEESDIEALSFTEEPLGGEDPHEFLEAIDYDEQTGLVLSDQVDACERQSLSYVQRRSGGGLRVRFCRTYRDPDIECSVGETHTQVTLAAVPVGFDSTPSGFGRGGSSRCRLPPGHPANDAAGVDQ